VHRPLSAAAADAFFAVPNRLFAVSIITDVVRNLGTFPPIFLCRMYSISKELSLVAVRIAVKRRDVALI
jgi:hypothetical protein